MSPAEVGSRLLSRLASSDLRPRVLTHASHGTLRRRGRFLCDIYGTISFQRYRLLRVAERAPKKVAEDPAGEENESGGNVG